MILTPIKLCAIWICWDDVEILQQSIKNISPYVDDKIVLWSDQSNTGELAQDGLSHVDAHCYRYEPDTQLDARTNELEKRNMGLSMAIIRGATHFLLMDADEIYQPFDKQQYDGNYVCETRLYFTPELYVEEKTRVPFIHRLTPNLRFQKNYEYPFSHDEGTPRIDPTRTMNITEGVEMAPVIMHHFSMLRRDIRKKLRNSAGLKVAQFKDVLIEDYKNAKEGYKSKFFNATMKKCDNIFSLPCMVDESLLGSRSIGADSAGPGKDT